MPNVNNKRSIMDIKTKLIEIIKTQKPELAADEILRLFSVVWQSEPLNICKPPKFNDWLLDNFTRRTEYYYDKNSNNETYSIKEIESQYVMKFRTNI